MNNRLRVAAALACLGLAGPLAAQTITQLPISAANSVLADTAGKKAPAAIHPEPLVSVRTGVSRPLREMKLPRPKPGVAGKNNDRERPQPGAPTTHDTHMHDPVAQKRVGNSSMPAPIQNFEGIGDLVGFPRPDPTMAVGRNDVGQFVNLSFEIFDKEGNSRTGGPVDGSAFWEGFGGNCEAAVEPSGEPIVLYDQLADRWVWSKSAFVSHAAQCFAVSVTSDPLGAYYLYEFRYFGIEGDGFGDFPKLGVWPDAYYMTVRDLGPAFSMTVTAFDRNAMLAGAPASGIFVSLDNPALNGLLPADLYGLVPPGAGGNATPPNVLIGIGHPERDGSPTPRLHIYYFHPDFGNPAASTFAGPVDIEVADFDPAIEFVDSLPQPPPGGNLQVLGVPEYQLPYRNFGDHESIVVIHDVFTDGVHVGPRWYEIRDPFGSPFVYQQGTYGPGDGLQRWMGSASIDGNNNIAIGFSVVNDTDTYPGIRYAGRLAGDTLGELAQGEAELVAGGADFGSDNWADYSTMTVDPVDECTFWYTTMYTPASAGGDWSTRIGSFKFSSCVTGPRGVLEGTVTDGSNPIEGARVAAGASSTLTDSSGHYSFTLPPGNDDMTASKYGYFPRSASGVSVTDGGDTVQTFVLPATPSVVVNGVVKDGSGGNWPLYAKVVTTAAGVASFTTFTDPVTGYYAFTLAGGLTYNFTVTSVSAGYSPGGGPVSLTAMAPVVANFQLIADQISCTAPGYTLSETGLVENFDAGGLPAGWAVTNDSADGGEPWVVLEGEDPCGYFGDNKTGGDGAYAIQNRNCDSLGRTEDTSLITPSVDLSGFGSAIVRFNSDFDCCFAGDTADVDISTNGGATWSNVFHATSNARGPRVEQVDITGIAAGQPDVRARFHYVSASFLRWWQVDDVALGKASCSLGAGGLIVGSVRDANTGAGLNGATVINLPKAGSTTAFATPEDPIQDDGLYILFAESGPQPFQASFLNFAPLAQSTLVIPNSTVRLDFNLAAGRLDASPRPLSARVNPGESLGQTITMTNTGAADASFRIYSGGTILNRFPIDLALPFGVMFNTDANDFWISNLGPPDFGGDNMDHRFLTNGAETADTIDVSSIANTLPVDGAYDANTGMLWQVFYGDVACVYELDPTARALTGKKICPAFSGSGTAALAYDPISDTFYSGSVDDNVLNHFDSSGTILDSTEIVAHISGLAFNPATGHLFALHQDYGEGSGPDLSVIDPKNNYAVVGAFYVGEPGTWGGGAQGMDMDCHGHLWLVSSLDVFYILEVDSGERGVCEDHPWLSEAPTSATVSASSTLPVTVTFDSAGLTPGLRQSQLNFTTNTPYGLDPVPVDFTVRFLDVPDGSFAENYIYGAAGAGIMPGCSSNNFCATTLVTRADMAGYIERSVHGPLTPPPAYTGIFSDVLVGDDNADYIQGLYDDGITAGCQGPGEPLKFCPTRPIPREQMAVFIEKGVRGGAHAPPACTPPGYFADTPCPGTYTDWVELLFADGITAGCNAPNDPPAFCGSRQIPNNQMAVFLVKAFHFPVLP